MGETHTTAPSSACCLLLPGVLEKSIYERGLGEMQMDMHLGPRVDSQINGSSKAIERLRD